MLLHNWVASKGEYLMRTIKRLAKSLLGLGSNWICNYEYKKQRFERFNERPAEFSFIFRFITKHYPCTVLDVGTGTTALPHLMRNCGCLVTASDNITDYWSGGMNNRHYHIVNDDITTTNLVGPFDLVTCISVLEHIKDSDQAISNMVSLLKPGGHLIVTFPYTEKQYIENVYKLPGSTYGQNAPYITQSYSRGRVAHWLNTNDIKIALQEYWQYWSGDHWTVGDQIIPPRLTSVDQKHQLTCILFEKQI